MTDLLTPEEAFVAMYSFLEAIYEQSGSDALGVLLGDMSLLPDGKPADMALSKVWEIALARAKSGRANVAQHLSERAPSD